MNRAFQNSTTTNMTQSRAAHPIVAAGRIALLLIGLSIGVCQAQTPAAADAPAPAVTLPPSVNDVVKLTKAGMGEDIVLAQIKGMAPVQLTTDQIIYLSNLGVSQNVIKALIQTGSSAAAPSAPQPAESKPSAGDTGSAGAPPPAAYPGASNGPAAPAAAGIPPVAPAAPAYPQPPAPVNLPPAQPSATSLAVPSNVEWVDTGIDLSAGDSVTVAASGTVSLAQHLPFIPNLQTPDGNPRFPSVDMFHPFIAPGLSSWSLVGKVSQFGAAFEVGSNSTFTAPAAGRLYLSVNANGFAGNTGNWNVTITFPPQVQPAAAAPPPTPPAEVNFDYFHEQLAPYGNWVQVGGYGWCWSPTVALQDPAWRPYADQGQWVYTDTGLFWQSAYPWGDIAFHYGRWTFAAGYGWLWLPDYTWGPAWVCWRHAEAEGFTGWAPLPPGATFVAGVGLMFNGVVAADIDFGMPAEAFVFVGYDHFWEHDYHGYFVPRDRAGYFYGRSYVRNGYRVEGGRFVVDGLGRERLGANSHHDMRVVEARELRGREEAAHFAARRTDPAIRSDLRPGARAFESRGQVIRKGPAPTPAAKPAIKVPPKPAAKPEEKKPE
jgi:hypothetical protein